MKGVDVYMMDSKAILDGITAPQDVQALPTEVLPKLCE